jgi:hypothetical protein
LFAEIRFFDVFENNMKIIKHFLVFLTAFTAFNAVFLDSAAAQTTSYYTKLTEKTCQEREADPESGVLYEAECEGVAGYKIILWEGDLRQFLYLKSPNGETLGPDLTKINNTLFSFIGKTVEWRVVKKGKTIKPSAIIFRYNIYKTPDSADKAESLLVVVKITKDNACIVGTVKPDVKNQNKKARELADASAGKPCVESD